jgi:15-cis-phytoene synthase / lycopene beta-cyclase
LIYSYSYCRVADDLVDDAPKEEEARKWIARLQTFLDMRYGTSSSAAASEAETQAYVRKTFPVRYHSGLLLLPTNALPSKPLYELLDGFRMDLEFHKQRIRKGDRRFPIEDEEALSQYGAYVAGTVGQLCVALIAYHYNGGKPLEHQEELLKAAGNMGIALQYVNIARDIVTDTKMERVYLPTTWLKEEDLTPEAVLKDPTGSKIAKLRARLLSEAFQLYGDCRKTMDWLPKEARGPMIAAVENYMEIGRVLTEKAEVGEPIPGRATVPFRRRLGVSLRALMFA